MLVLGCHGNACGGQRTAWFAFLLLYGLLQESWLVSSRAVLLSLPPISPRERCDYRCEPLYLAFYSDSWKQTRFIQLAHLTLNLLSHLLGSKLNMGQ